MDPRLRRLVVALLVVAAALWLGSRGTDLDAGTGLGPRPAGAPAAV